MTPGPLDPSYWDAAALDAEERRVFEVCHGCRMCFNLCPSFPALFDLIDAADGALAAVPSARFDRVVDLCFQCKLCYVKCPYTPPHPWDLDFPRLLLRAKAVRARQRGVTR